jgi:hypothetical protein
MGKQTHTNDAVENFGVNVPKHVLLERVSKLLKNFRTHGILIEKAVKKEIMF